MRILFAGCDNFALESLQTLHQAIAKATTSQSNNQDTTQSSESESQLNSNSQLSLLTAADVPRGRDRDKISQLPIKLFALAQGIKVYQLPPRCDFALSQFELPLDWMQQEPKFDILIAVSFGYKIPPRILDAFPLGGLNVHASLLPLYAGASPIQHALLHNERQTGVSIIELHPHKIDSGRVLHQQSTRIEDTETFEQLRGRLAQIGAQALLHTLNNLDDLRVSAHNSTIAPSHQAQTSENTLSASESNSDSAQNAVDLSSNSAYAIDRLRAPKLNRSFGQVSWQASPTAIYARWRATKGFMPLFTHALVEQKARAEDSNSNIARTSSSPPGDPIRVLLHQMAVTRRSELNPIDATAFDTLASAACGAFVLLPHSKALAVRCGNAQQDSNQSDSSIDSVVLLISELQIASRDRVGARQFEAQLFKHAGRRAAPKDSLAKFRFE